jgi:ATP-dependent exoDNAse (exonuclease V) beta subunit
MSFRVGILITLDLQQKVSIATCHAAKGLEWPVIFVPAGLSLPVYCFFLRIFYTSSYYQWNMEHFLSIGQTTFTKKGKHINLYIHLF